MATRLGCRTQGEGEHRFSTSWHKMSVPVMKCTRNRSKIKVCFSGSLWAQAGRFLSDLFTSTQRSFSSSDSLSWAPFIKKLNLGLFFPTWRILHFELINFISLVSASPSDHMTWPNLGSSANFLRIDMSPAAMSLPLMKIINKEDLVHCLGVPQKEPGSTLKIHH